jgi:hypothetical protein
VSDLSNFGKLFLVRSVDWCEDEDIEVRDAFDADDAARAWCKIKEDGGSFCGDYPDNHLLRIVTPDGTECFRRVSTDFMPHYYSSKAEAPALRPDPKEGE